MSHPSESRPNGDSAVHADGVTWKLNSVPVTASRAPTLNAHQYLDRPDLPRADAAPSKETPVPQSTDGQSVLQAHCAFFDSDGDGIVYPTDTYHGFHSIGFNWIPDLRFPLHLKNIDRCKHGSDSAVYDTEGRYVPAKFEDIFSKYGKSQKGAISRGELVNMIIANRNIMDPVGWTATTLEWGALWWIAKDEKGLLTKERVRANYDGSLWYILAREQNAKKQKAVKAA